jgi:5'-3' exonuclease
LTSDHLLLVDASGFAYRAFATASPVHRASDGQPIGAVLRFLDIAWRLLGAAESDKPTHAVAAFDPPGKTFRHKLFPGYKANRPAARAVELEGQLAIMRAAADVLGLVPIEAKGFEADDVIATLANSAQLNGIRTTIVSSDKDFGQLVVDGWIEIVDPMSRARRLSSDIVEKFGVPPHLVQDVQALAGDPVDGIPGIPGVGLDKAARLVRRFGSLEDVLANAKDCRWPAVRSQLKKGADDARLYLKLTTLRRDVPIIMPFDDLRVRPVMRSHLVELCRALEAPAWAMAMFTGDPQFSRAVPHVSDQFEWWREELLASGQRLPDDPQSGFYHRRLVKSGPFVPARIWREPEIDAETGKPTGRDVVRCEVGGMARDPFNEWARLSMSPIAKAAYEFEMADAAHAKKWRPDDPKASPTVPVDLSKTPVSRNPNPKRKSA